MSTAKIIVLVCLCLCFAVEASASGAVAASWPYVEKKLKKAGFKKSFISALHKNYDPGEFNTVVELNCLLFLRKSDYHTPQVSGQAVGDVRHFIETHRKALANAEKKYAVPGSVVAGLLWLESRYGENQGRFHVESAFLDLLQADRKPVIAHLREEAAPRFTPKLTAKESASIAKKGHDKAGWALGELKAMQGMWVKDRNLTNQLHGSFAGAFGMPQFIPSSYMTYARAARPGQAADLSHADDAILSVAFYLHKSGWRNGKVSTHERALLKYNNSHDYARAILKLADLADGDGKRVPAGVHKRKRRVRAVHF